MKSMGTKKIVYGALMASLITVATMVIHIPSAFNGYIHLGDGLVLISGILLGPMTGGISAGIGSMMADLLSGYAFYAPATLIIKALASFLSGYLYQKLMKRSGTFTFRLVPFLSSGLICSSIVTGGYFLFECVVYGKSAALLNIPLNLVQNSFSLIIAGTLLPFLLRRNELRNDLQSI
ncbi:ECF transporter S component [Lacrimispora aerotolerans]|uniref:ECF transporter S component n=1 Tax=Lacrimispora aerotolerans TaxID=36832 RepID=UPI0004793E8D|nr:ECF transporter S component [Lacrimispora aerotolerans]